MDKHDDNFSDERLRIRLIEAMLDYFEGDITLSSVLDLGITAYHNKNPIRNSIIAEVVSVLNAMGRQVADGKNIPSETIKETLTTMLEKLIGRDARA